MRRILFSALLLFAPFHTVSAITVTDLPGQLQTCIGNSSCAVTTASALVDYGNMQAYAYTDLSGGSPMTGYALRYALTSPSGRNVTDGGFTSYTGYVWLTVYDSYDLSADSNLVAVYTDTVTPTPANLLIGDSNGLDIAIDMQNTALLSGNGYRLIGLDADLNTIDQGTMTLLGDRGFNALLPCLAEGCSSQATLNLLYLSVVSSGGIAFLNFNAADTRSLLYQVSLYDPYGYDLATDDYTGILDTQSYYINAVPLPAAAWLFGSGLLGLVGITRRKKTY
jgi:hypothetical protein